MAVIADGMKKSKVEKPAGGPAFRLLGPDRTRARDLSRGRSRKGIVAMPSMPTTRRGRFLFYKARAKRREQVVHWRRQRSGTLPTQNKKATTRAIDLSVIPKQVTRVYPRHFPEKAMEAWEWLALGWSPPHRSKFGWLGEGSWVYPPPGLRGSGREAAVGYHDRRVKSIPRLRNLPRKAYLYTHAELTEQAYYPSDFYPSGSASYRSVHFP